MISKYDNLIFSDKIHSYILLLSIFQHIILNFDLETYLDQNISQHDNIVYSINNFIKLLIKPKLNMLCYMYLNSFASSYELLLYLTKSNKPFDYKYNIYMIINSIHIIISTHIKNYCAKKIKQITYKSNNNIIIEDASKIIYTLSTQSPLAKPEQAAPPAAASPIKYSNFPISYKVNIMTYIAHVAHTAIAVEETVETTVKTIDRTDSSYNRIYDKTFYITSIVSIHGTNNENTAIIISAYYNYNNDLEKLTNVIEKTITEKHLQKIIIKFVTDIDGWCTDRKYIIIAALVALLNGHDKATAATAAAIAANFYENYKHNDIDNSSTKDNIENVFNDMITNLFDPLHINDNYVKYAYNAVSCYNVEEDFIVSVIAGITAVAAALKATKFSADDDADSDATASAAAAAGLVAGDFANKCSKYTCKVVLNYILNTSLINNSITKLTTNYITAAANILTDVITSLNTSDIHVIIKNQDVIATATGAAAAGADADAAAAAAGVAAGVANYYIDNVLKNINLADELAANINDIDAYNQYLDAIDNVAKNANIYAIVAYVANNANAANAVIAVIIIVIHLITDSITSITRIINDTKSSNFYWHISNILNTYTNIAQYAIKQYLIKYPANAADAADAADANAANVDGANGVNIRRLNFYDKIALPNEYSIKQYDDDAINSAVRNAAITAIIANRTDYILSTHYARKESVVGADNVEPLTKTYVEATTEISGKDESNKRNYFIKQFIKNCKLQDTTLLTEIATTLETQSKKYIPRISLKEGDFSGTSLTIFTNYQKRLYNIDNIKISFKRSVNDINSLIPKYKYTPPVATILQDIKRIIKKFPLPANNTVLENDTIQQQQQQQQQQKPQPLSSNISPDDINLYKCIFLTFYPLFFLQLPKSIKLIIGAPGNIFLYSCVVILSCECFKCLPHTLLH